MMVIGLPFAGKAGLCNGCPFSGRSALVNSTDSQAGKRFNGRFLVVLIAGAMTQFQVLCG
jgi:hypothetical protein